MCAITLAIAACGSDDAADPAPPQDTPQSSIDPTTATVVIVANANIDDGSANRMAEALSLAGFNTGPAVTATEKIDRSVVFHVDSTDAAETAQQVGKIMGGLPVLSLLDDQVWTESGTLDGGGVLVLLGQNEADRTLDDLNGSSGGGGTTGGDDTTGGNDEPVGGTVECSESAVRAGLEGVDYEIADIFSLNCNNGWALVGISAKFGGDGPVDIFEVLEAEGQFWILKNKGDVCGSEPEYDDNGQPIRPNDAQVPAELWYGACAGG